MGRENERGGALKERSARINRSLSVQSGRALRRGPLRLASKLLLAMLALHSVGTCGFGQQTQQLAPKTLIFDVDKPQTQPLEYRFHGTEPRAETELEFKADGQWHFIRFDQVPPKTTVLVKGKIDGYSDSEPLQANRWYSFKDPLAVVLKISREASTPAILAFSFGSPSRQSAKDFLKGPDLKADDVRKFPDKNEVKPDPPAQLVQFFWDPKSLSDATPTPFSLAAYLIDENPEYGIGVVILLIILLSLFVFYGSPMIAGLIEYLQKPRRRGSSGREQHRISPLDALTTDSTSLTSKEKAAPTQTDAGPTYRPKAYNPTRGDLRRTEEARPPQHQAGDVILPPAKPAAPSFKQPHAQAINADGHRLEQLIKAEVQQLRTTLAQKADRQQQEQLLVGAKQDFEDKLNRADQRLDRIRKELEDMVHQQGSLMEKTRADLNSQVKEVDDRGRLGQRQLEDLLKEVLAESRKVDTKLEARFSQIQTALNLKTVPESFFNKTLGAVLGQNVETLQDGNFERLIGEKLNQFFQTGVDHGDGLQELRVRAERVSSALKDVSLQMERLNPQGRVEAQQSIQQFEAFLNELSGLQSQMQTRRKTIETIVHIPVSLHPGARQTFLDELGRGIRREIDKLNDPQKYFEAEMERLITTDLIGIVEICDKTVAPPPGSRPELEAVLKQLFERAGLSPILPRQGEPFKTGEQDLIEMAHGTGQSLTVAQVITRGFYYKHRDEETLLRKAAVTVYR